MSILRVDQIQHSNGTAALTIDSSGRVSSPNRPSFYVIGNQNTTYTNQVVPFNTIVTNVGGNYDTSTYRFTAPVAGYYFFTLYAILGPNATGVALASIRKNSSSEAFVHRNTSSNLFAWEQGSCSAVLYLQNSDFVDCYIGEGTLYSGTYYSGFSGYLVG